MIENEKAICDEFSEVLIGYINRRLSQVENIAVIKHLYVCKECRNEVALLIKIKNSATENMVSVPHDIIKTAFEKIPKEENKIDKIINSGSILMPFELLSYFLSPVKQTLKLVKQII